jgi:hypothetical protein
MAFCSTNSGFRIAQADYFVKYIIALASSGQEFPRTAEMPIAAYKRAFPILPV